MATATLIRDGVGGHAAPARVWRLDPPARIAGHDHEYACSWITPATAYQDAEVVLVASTESGAVAGRSVHRRAGSLVLHEDPDTPEYVDGVHWLALQVLGGYEIASPE